MPKKNKNYKLSVILPTLNEADNLNPLIESLDKNVSPFEILIIDDNSTDNTAITAKTLKKKYPYVKHFENKTRIGLTLSIQKGIDLAKGDLIAWMDADLSHPPEVLKKMLEKLSYSDIVTGSWLTKGGQDKRKEIIAKIGSLLINKLCSHVFKSHLTSFTSGFVVAKRKVFNSFRLKGDYGEYFIYFLVKLSKKGFTITEVPFVCVSRTKGESKTLPNIDIYSRRGFKYLKMVANLKLNRL